MRIGIASRYSLTSGPLAESVVKKLDVDAFAVRPEDLLPMIEKGSIDLVVICADLHFDNQTGLDIARRLSGSYPDVQIVILINEASRESVFRAFRAGARGVFDLNEPMCEFIDCIQHVIRGFIWVGPSIAATVLQLLRRIPSPSPLTEDDAPPLTVREMQVVKCAARGLTNRAIAIELCLSEHTVKNYLFRAFEKLGVSSRVELLFYLTAHGHFFGSDQTVEEFGELSKAQ